MSKRPKKRDKPLTSRTDVSEAIERFAATDPNEIAAAPRAGLVPLVEDDSGHRFLVYAAKDGPRAELRFEGETFWASQGQMAEMFGVSQSTISEHISGIFSDGELTDSEATHRKFRLVRQEGGREVGRNIDHYDLNTLIAVGYRVGSVQGTLFRVWATDKLFQILTKGFYIDEQRLMSKGAPDVLDEFRETARKIRTSIRNSYREVLRLCTLSGFVRRWRARQDKSANIYVIAITI
jgi:hypothetical protein